jgi:hypothetical protein
MPASSKASDPVVKAHPRWCLLGMGGVHREKVAMRLEDLTDEQRCVLLNAVEESYLFEVLNECSCSRGTDWPDRMPGVPRLARIVQDFIDKGLVTLYRDADEVGQPPVDIPNDQAPAILADSANWWSPDGVRTIALAPTDDGLAVYTGHPVTIPDADQ